MKEENLMEIKKEYAILFNAITDVTKELEKLTGGIEICLQILKNAQEKAEEIYISAENEDE